VDIEDLKKQQQFINHKNKVPYQPLIDKHLQASTTNPNHWSTFDVAEEAFLFGVYDGVGFVFKKGGGIIGIDLDGCRNPDTGDIAPWAKKIIDQFNSYTEVSPSGTGIHIFVKGKLPTEVSGWKKHFDHPEFVPSKKPAIEIYQHSRYFTFTGQEII
jgi:primase-polymerase (primpol)-like protein